VCEHYADIKRDYLYRGDVLRAVPFVSLDANPISVRAAEDPKLPTFQQAPFADESETAGIKYPVLCVATLERLDGVVLTRTCEANKRPKQSKVFGSVMVAPIRPFNDFAIDKHTGRPFHELVLEGFPADSPDEPPGQCLRFMFLQPCADHGLPNGGLVCFREAQPVPIRHLLNCERVTRLAIPTVGALDYRFSVYMQQTEDDNSQDSAPEGPESPIVAGHKKRITKRAEERQAMGPAGAT
jgi:hypothetical protein